MQAQVDTKNKITIVNDHLATLPTKVNTLDGMQKNLSTFFQKFIEANFMEQPLHQEGFESSPSMGIHSHTFVHDLFLPKVDVNKFDGLDPTILVTQMKHYFSLDGIINDLMKLCVGVLYLYLEC
jgi:hypothetical protein